VLGIGPEHLGFGDWGRGSRVLGSGNSVDADGRANPWGERVGVEI